MKRILLPLEDTERSLKALQFVKSNYSSRDVDVVLMMVDESIGYTSRPDIENAALSALEEKLELISASLAEFEVIRKTAVGKAGVRIVRTAREVGADIIVMTKSSKDDMLSSIGRTTEYVINNAQCPVLVVNEIMGNQKYRGLVYRKASSIVNLRGQLGDKQSECLLPSVNVDCIYHIDMTVGRIKFIHTSYNPVTRAWDLPPASGQEAYIEIDAGERVDILIKADSTKGRADRIRIVNRDMKKEAVFSYKITAADSKVDNTDN
ncbi:MAG TPA: universal stress protein [Mogibacterium sp.]|nr:universal stress protein [Mogibacterium sp.]